MPSRVAAMFKNPRIASSESTRSVSSRPPKPSVRTARSRLTYTSPILSSAKSPHTRGPRNLAIAAAYSESAIGTLLLLSVPLPASLARGLLRIESRRRAGHGRSYGLAGHAAWRLMPRLFLGPAKERRVRKIGSLLDDERRQARQEDDRLVPTQPPELRGVEQRPPVEHRLP